MKHMVGSLGIIVVAAMLGGCAGARAKTQAPNDVFGAMDKELAQTVAKNGDSLDAMSDELSHAIGTTSLTSEVLLSPMPLPDSRMSLSEDAKPAVQTWGTSSMLDISEIPDTRE